MRWLRTLLAAAPREVCDHQAESAEVRLSPEASQRIKTLLSEAKSKDPQE